MMLEKDIDCALVGKNYLSFSFALALIDLSREVLLIDDNRVNLGEGLLTHMGELERSLLIQWGEKFDLEPFVYLNRYLTQKKINLIVGDKMLMLGGSPYENLLEILRKYPSCFENPEILLPIGENKQEFNYELIQFCQRVANITFHFKKFSEINKSIFLTDLPSSIKEIFQSFYCFAQKKPEDEVNLDFRILMTFCQNFYQVKIGEHCSEAEAYHILLTLLSPHYEVDYERLSHDLEMIFKERGGRLKSTKVEHWQIHGNRTRHLQLASFEGVVFPKKIFYLGSFHSDIPFLLESKQSVYKSFKFEIKWPENQLGLETLLSDMVYFWPKEQLGTEVPSWSVKVNSPSNLEVRVYYLSGKGLNPIVFLNQTAKKVVEKMSKYYHLSDLDYQYGLVEFNAHDEAISVTEKQVHNQFLSDRPYRNNWSILQYSNPQVGKALSGIHYMGPLRGHSMGLFSLLLDLRDLVEL